MTKAEGSGTYRALPPIDNGVMTLILGDPDGLLARMLGEEVDDGESLALIDEELESLSQANPNLADFVRSTVEAIYASAQGEIRSERTKVLLRVVAYTNAFTLLRLLDMQMRLDEAAEERAGEKR